MEKLAGDDTSEVVGLCSKFLMVFSNCFIDTMLENALEKSFRIIRKFGDGEAGLVVDELELGVLLHDAVKFGDVVLDR